ncbi:uncharacterized protein LOC112503843 isoform X2 [Cynara cardunculus var. scolymus]|uniref:uncharacterized protein LOC112503843 isoform X2 n=1 Tax=Cynara cardunculus var. scolymus TaxID=59895 RepID=UPI000D62D87E|nr:uncharacterized protein LOC112503843 isoform X2 [Cynara cardunculus var. scolymus]
MGCEGTMDIEVGPIEETVQALMEYLVGPLLPLKHSDISKRIPSESQQKSVAEQVHAAAVLYNYYHIKHHQKREFLKFDQFCNLAIMFKPSILHHMKYMRQSDRPIIDDPENQLSLTEKAIMDACTISETLLDASANISSIIKGWPITKVAVLLIDSKRENCFLQFNNGVWSVIEKEISSEVSGIGSESKTNKKRRMLYMNKDDAEGEAGFQQLALSAVKEVAGIITGELVVLEGHVVYSLSRAKTATRFYIVQSTQPISEDSLVPIQDAICSLQGPVVRKSSGSWVITPVVEYYHLLPYAEKISEWFSRVSNSLQHQVEEGSADESVILGSQKSYEKESGESKRVSYDNVQIKSNLELESVHMSNSSKENRYKSNKHCTTLEPIRKAPQDVATSCSIEFAFDKGAMETENSNGNRITEAYGDSLKQKDMNGASGASNKGLDRPMVSLQKGNQNTKMHTPLKVYRHEKRSTTNAINNKEGLKGLKNMSTVSKCRDQSVDGEKKTCIDSPHENAILAVDCALASVQQNAESIEDFQITVDAKRSELSEAALRALLKKREKLCNQQRNIEAELTLCDKKIQAIMHGGIGDCLGLKLEAVIDCCNEICQKDENRDLHVGKSLPFSGKSLSEAQIILRNACQELDDICLSNNWMLPTYHTSCSDGGFVANVTVKGTDFECSDVSGIQASIREARNSAATLVIMKLQQMAIQHTTALH